MGKRIAAIQSNYIPWKGYFDAINTVDEFILLDEVQYTKRDWRNRNRIKTPTGPLWLTIPVAVKGRYAQRIDETLIADPEWAEKHWRTLTHAYARTRYFDEVAAKLEPVYHDAPQRLSEVNRALLEVVCGMLGITTPLVWSTDYSTTGVRGERLLQLCSAAGADEYISGPAAQAYMEVAEFERQGVAVRWMDYSGYPEYPQDPPPFEHGLSILDLLFRMGPEAPMYLKTLNGSVDGFI